MNRQQEYWELIRELDEVPPTLDGTALRAKSRAKRRRTGRRWGISLGSVAGVCAAFVLAVNTLPTFALACSNVPILRELAAAVSFSPSLSAAVEHNYVQYVGQTQTWNGVTLTLDYVIADQQQMVVFYRTKGIDDPHCSVSCDLKDENGVPLFGYTVISGDSEEELKKFEIHFKELEEIPQTLTLNIELIGTDLEGNSQRMGHVYTFQIILDSTKTAPAVEIPVGQWVEMNGQRLLVDYLELTPTKTTLHLMDDPDNSAWLQDFDFYFTDEDGKTYDAIDGSISASGRSEGTGFYTYYFQSLYFTEDYQSLTLWIEGAVWLDKNAQPVTVNLADGSWSGVLPDEMGSLSVENISAKDGGEGWVILQAQCTSGRPPFELEYRDPEGGIHSTGGYSRRDDRDAPYSYQFEYTIKNYSWDTLELTLSYTSSVPLKEPMPVPLG